VGKWPIHKKYLSDDMKAKGHISRLSVNEKIILKLGVKGMGAHLRELD
jgi:hypothetical protein